MVRFAVVAPLMLPSFTRFVPFTCQWYFNGTVPMAVTAKVTFDPTTSVWFVGCTVIIGDDTTVKNALELVAVIGPAMTSIFVTITV